MKFVRAEYIESLRSNNEREKIRRAPQLPNHVIMIDDKRKHVDSVHAAVVSSGRHFDGLHYTHLDEKVASFNIEPAKRQLSLLYPRLNPSTQQAVDALKLLDGVDSMSVAAPTMK